MKVRARKLAPKKDGSIPFELRFRFKDEQQANDFLAYWEETRIVPVGIAARTGGAEGGDYEAYNAFCDVVIGSVVEAHA